MSAQAEAMDRLDGTLSAVKKDGYDAGHHEGWIAGFIFGSFLTAAAAVFAFVLWVLIR